MTRVPVQAGFDTWVDSAHPSDTHGDDKFLHFGGGNRTAYIHTAQPAPSDGTVQTPTEFTVYAGADWSGSTTLTLRRVTDPWKQRTTNFNNKPGATNTGSVTVTVGALSDGDPITFNVKNLVAAMAAGTNPNYGFQLTADVQRRIYSTQAGRHNPTLVVNYVEGPAAPTKLLPGGGLVGVAAPTLQWTYTGSEDMASYRVQLDPAANETTPAYDSGTLSSSDSIHALDGTSYGGLADGASTWWRVMVTDTAGQESDWSDWVSMTRDDKGTGAINSPGVSPNNYVTEPTPELLFALTGETLTAFQVLITAQTDHNDIKHDSGKVTATTGEYTVPEKDSKTLRRRAVKRPILVSGGLYSLCVRMYDTKQRQGSIAAGDEPYVEVWRDFTMIDTGTVTAPVITTVAQAGQTPAVTVTFTRGTAPDGFIVLRDGIEITTPLDPADLFVSGTSYAFTDWSAHPGVAHVYKAKAVVNGVQSNASPAVTLTGGTKVDGVWVIDPDTVRWFRCVARDTSSGVDEWAQVEVGADYLPLGGQTGFRITQTLGGLAGSYQGALKPYAGRTVEDMAADLFGMKADAPHSEFRLVADYLNIPVGISTVVCSVWEGRPVTGTRRRVSFNLKQTGEFEFDGNL